MAAVIDDHQHVGGEVEQVDRQEVADPVGVAADAATSGRRSACRRSTPATAAAGARRSRFRRSAAIRSLTQARTYVRPQLRSQARIAAPARPSMYPSPGPGCGLTVLVGDQDVVDQGLVRYGRDQAAGRAGQCQDEPERSPRSMFAQPEERRRTRPASVSDAPTPNILAPAPSGIPTGITRASSIWVCSATFGATPRRKRVNRPTPGVARGSGHVCASDIQVGSENKLTRRRRRSLGRN